MSRSDRKLDSDSLDCDSLLDSLEPEESLAELDESLADDDTSLCELDDGTETEPLD